MGQPGPPSPSSRSPPGDQLQGSEPPPTDPVAWLTCHHAAVSASAASEPLPRDCERRFRSVMHHPTSIAFCAPVSNRATHLPPCRVPHHPSSFVGFDRHQPFQRSVHFSSPVGRDLPLSQLRNRLFRRFAVKLQLLYTPPIRQMAGRDPLPGDVSQLAGALRSAAACGDNTGVDHNADVVHYGGV